MLNYEFANGYLSGMGLYWESFFARAKMYFTEVLQSKFSSLLIAAED